MKIRLDHPLWQRLAPRLAARLVQAWFWTCRKELQGPPAAMALVHSGAPLLYANWHCHLLFPLYYFMKRSPRERTIVLMTSPSRDGAFIAGLARTWGYVTCPGSRHKGGLKALADMAGYFRLGHSSGLAADGSRGPARVVQKGVLFLAREAQAPILPMAVASRRKITFNSWDRFELPLPFSPIVLLLGEPLRLPPGIRGPGLEAARRELEARLNLLYQRSQSYFSR